MSEPRDVAQRTCPGCGTHVENEPYDIGSGPELACPNCETCFGAEGQSLNPYDPFLSLAKDAKAMNIPQATENMREPALMLAMSPCRQCGKPIASRWTVENGTTPVEHCDDHS